MVWDFFFAYILSSRAGAVVRRIAWISLIAVAVSVGSLILVLSVMRALNLSIEERTLAVDPHLVISVAGVRSSPQMETQPAVLRSRERTDWKVHTVETQDLIVRTAEGRFRGGVGKGYSPEGLSFLMSEIQRVRKLNVDPEASVLQQDEVVLGVELAHALGVFEGDTLLIAPPEGLLLPVGERPPVVQARVHRIIATNIPEVDTQAVFYVSDHSLRALRKAHSLKIETHVWTDNANRVESYRSLLTQFPDTRVDTWRERNSALFFALKLEKSVIGLFLTLASLVAGFSLFSVIGLLISQKRNDIGILQAMGMSKNQVGRLFMQMGLVLTAVSVGVGVLLGSALSLYLEYYPLQVLPDIYIDSEIPAHLEVSLVATIFVVSLLLGLWGMRLGTRAVTRLTPTQCLRNN